MDKINYSRIYQAKRRARLKAEGKCQWCGKRDARPSKYSPSQKGSLCEQCAKKSAKKSREILARHRRAWVKLGICVACGKAQSLKATSNGKSTDTRCAACAEWQAEYNETHPRKRPRLPKTGHPKPSADAG